MEKQYRLSEFCGDVEVVDNYIGLVLCKVDEKYKKAMELYVEYLNGASPDDRLGAVER